MSYMVLDFLLSYTTRPWLPRRAAAAGPLPGGRFPAEALAGGDLEGETAGQATDGMTGVRPRTQWVS
jgi:hypothetical protein